MRYLLLLFFCIQGLVSAQEGEADSVFTFQTDSSAVVADTVSQKIRFIRPYKFFTPSPVLNKPRVYTVTGAVGGIYGIANIWFSKAWYADFPRSKFHLFNDAGEWQQMDKVGHAQAAYFISRWSYNLYHWSGVSERHAPWIGAVWGNVYQLAIEMQDGFSEQWGFSFADVGFNMGGSLLFLGQQYLWHDQRLTLKLSSWPEKYPDDQKARAKELYGTSFGEQLLKDYNANTFWLSASPGAFIKKPDSKFPKWIAVSFGYGAKGMLGGFSNCYCSLEKTEISDCPPENIVDQTDVERVRQFYLSFDIDWTRIPTKSNALKTFFQLINIIKIPFPAVEFNTGGQVKWHWIKF